MKEAEIPSEGPAFPSGGLTPHGPGFRFVDRFEYRDDQSGIAWKFLDPNAPYFRDHFPDQPVMPAVLIAECAAQAAGILIMRGKDSPSDPLYLASIDQFRIYGAVYPDQTLITQVTLDREFGPLAVVSVQCNVENRMVARGKLTLSRLLRGS